MNFINILSKEKNAYIIAEIGNNHQGSFEEALKMADEAISCGVNAIKFQRRNNKNLFTDTFYSSPYQNPNSFGDSYGEHRENLELSLIELEKIKLFVESKNCDFLVTPFDLSSLEDLEKINCSFYKIASADIVHIPLIEKIAKTYKPIIMSTGYSTYSDIDRAVSKLDEFKSNYSLLHCTASYPAEISDMNLNCIPEMIKRYPKAFKIGLSDHENGIDCASVGYLLGARIFEKHFTLNRANKGTDNSFSLEPSGMKKLVRNIKRIPISLGESKHKLLKSEEKPVYKMRKSIVYKCDLKKNEELNLDNLEFRCPGNGLEPYHVYEIIGKTLDTCVKKHQCFEFSHISK